MTRRAVAILIAALVVGAGLVAYCRPTPTPIPRTEQRTIDSLAITKPSFDSTTHALAQRETIFVAQSRQNAQIAALVRRTADSLRQVANVAEASARAARDTSSRWFRVAQLNRQEADTLRVALDAATIRGNQLDSALVASRERGNLLNARLLSVEDLSHRLAADVAKPDPCRVLFVARCPSRKTSALLGAAAALGAALYGKHLVALVNR